MNSKSIETPVLLIGYNRPSLFKEQLTRLFTTFHVRNVFIAIDGAKRSTVDERKVAQVVSIAKDFLRQYPERVELSYSKKNLGCRKGVERAINWFFTRVEEGIVLEDDCVPDPSFFPYCEILLAKYRHDERVAMICGTNPLVKLPVTSSYFFSDQSMVWGWATWKRAWVDYDSVALQARPIVHGHFDTQLAKHTSSAHIQIIKKVFAREVDTWDYVWYTTNILTGRKTIIPTKNLVANVGFNGQATHTRFRTMQADLKTFPQQFPLRHPSSFLTQPSFEQRYLNQIRRTAVIFSIVMAFVRSAFFPGRESVSKTQFGSQSK